MTRRTFLSGSDVMKAELFGCDISQWKRIERKVKEWVEGGWERWEEEKPE